MRWLEVSDRYFRARARELQAHMRKYAIDGWLDHGDPGQRRPAPALTRSPGAPQPG
ncbi:MAG TPA: hypothetical protein VHU92_03480 [Streptosporangiaceae bacterium]|nr:hypothetical protein [Streptosporangiaceae bacterium]